MNITAKPDKYEPAPANLLLSIARHLRDEVNKDSKQLRLLTNKAFYFFSEYETSELLQIWPQVWSNESPGHKNPNGRNDSPRVHEVNFASGEMVMANRRFQLAVRYALGETKLDYNVDAFEMEAYGVAKVCGSLGIPFLTVRGISDTGTEEKNGGEKKTKDAHHLYAVCAASSFVRVLLIDEFTKKTLPSRHSHPEDIPKCLDPRVASFCPQKEVHECVLLPPVWDQNLSSRLHLVRVYDGMQPAEFSKLLSSIVSWERFKRVGVRLLFVFPYSAEELANIVLTALPHPILNDLASKADWLLKNREQIKNKFPHFREVEQHIGPGLTAERIIAIKQEKLDECEKKVYSSVLSNWGSGDNGRASKVKTFIVQRGEYFDKLRTFPDDVTIVEEGDGSKGRWAKAFYYFRASELLLMRGWHCEAARYEGVQRGEDRVFGLSKKWSEMGREEVEELDIDEPVRANGGRAV